MKEEVLLKRADENLFFSHHSLAVPHLLEVLPAQIDNLAWLVGEEPSLRVRGDAVIRVGMEKDRAFNTLEEKLRLLDISLAMRHSENSAHKHHTDAIIVICQPQHKLPGIIPSHD